MAKEKQEEAARKLIRITKPGKPIVIIYNNPDVFWNSKFLKNLSLMKGEHRTHIDENSQVQPNTLFFILITYRGGTGLLMKLR